MSIFTKAGFKTPNFSVFDHSHSNSLTFGVGEVTPVYYADLAPGERVVMNPEQLTRFIPMLAPVYQNCKVDIDCHFVPYRILGKKYENFFNPGTDRVSNPLLTRSVQDAIPSLFQSGLMDYLGLPTFPKLRDWLRVQLYSSNPLWPLFDDTSSEFFGTNWFSVPSPQSMAGTDFELLRLTHLFNGIDNADGNPSFYLTLALPELAPDTPVVWVYEDSSAGTSFAFVPFVKWLFNRLDIPHDLTSGGYFTSPVLSDFLTSGESDFLGYILGKYEVSLDSLYDEYLTYVLSSLLSNNLQLRGYTAPDPGDELDPANWTVLNTFIEEVIPVLSDQFGYEEKWNFLPWLCYWRAIFDWYINTNIDGDGDELFQGLMDAFEDDSITDLFKDGPFYLNASHSENLVRPFLRRWANDYFTSCFLSGSVPNVRIPVNPTVQDLRSSNRLQKFLERTLYAGKRYIDQILAHFGVVSSNARFDRTEVIGRETCDVNIQSIFQTSQSDFPGQAPLGSYAGNGISVSSPRGIDYTCEENGMFMVFVSVRPTASYFQGINKLLLKTGRYDFLVPEFADTGEQAVDYRELYYDFGASYNGSPFGYNRRYAEYMYSPNEVHGLFRGDLRYWTGARFFDQARAHLNSSFIRVEPHKDGDDFNRIFALDSNDTVMMYLYFDIKIVRPLPRYINYSL